MTARLRGPGTSVWSLAFWFRGWLISLISTSLEDEVALEGVVVCHGHEHGNENHGERVMQAQAIGRRVNTACVERQAPCRDQDIAKGLAPPAVMCGLEAP